MRTGHADGSMQTGASRRGMQTRRVRNGVFFCFFDCLQTTYLCRDGSIEMGDGSMWMGA